MSVREDKIVLFLCTGNYYRSRFAEALFNSVARKMNLPWKASSRRPGPRTRRLEHRPDGGVGCESTGKARD